MSYRDYLVSLDYDASFAKNWADLLAAFPLSHKRMMSLGSGYEKGHIISKRIQ
jgi:hypothetical protein